MRKAFQILVLLSFLAVSLSAQLKNLRGNFNEYRTGVFDGNLFRINFFNDGMPGGNKTIGQYGGEWPINSGNFYLLDGIPHVASEVKDNYGSTKGTLRYVKSMTKNNCTSGDDNCGDRNPITGDWWTFLPLPGFANPAKSHIAMVKAGLEEQDSWPAYWPDIADPENLARGRPYEVDGWAGSWNGYFGRDVFNADQEAYAVADDYTKQEFPNFRPDTNDLARGGLGMRMFIRGFEWTKTLVEDGLFVLYDIENMGTYDHKKVVFGYKIGNNVGERVGASEAGDDGGYFIREEDLAFTYDNDGVGASGWQGCVGILGGAFLESPGNPFDGIDNDNDSQTLNITSPVMTTDGPKEVYPNSGVIISTSMFLPRTLGLDDKIVLIDYSKHDLPRIVTTLRTALGAQGKSINDTLAIEFGESVYKFWDGCVIQEDTLNGSDLFDNNLNGIIDESRGARVEGLYRYLYTGYRAINYLDDNPQTNGTLNPLIDEKRDDGIDNNKNWNPETDDVGNDGQGPIHPKYSGPDPNGSENNGVPNVGEPSFDATDIYETDMVGLTSFWMYQFASVKEYDDERHWDFLKPGNFMITISVGNVELLFGSGYFPMPPKHIERFSMGLMCGETAPYSNNGKDLAEAKDSSFIGDLVRNKREFQRAYESNYNFARAPVTPRITAVVTGNKRVAIFWNDDAERYSYDPFADDPNKIDFEGYKIYRSTYPDWSDLKVITDYKGQRLWHLPLAQYDLVNNYSGFFPLSESGAHFFLGSNTGLQHYYIDTTVANGITYYYAVTSYDHGAISKNITPSECAKYAAITASGDFLRGPNVVRARPEAPSAGFVDASLGQQGIVRGIENTAQGKVEIKVLNRDWVKNNHRYRITFQNDTISVFTLKPGAGLDLGIVRKTKSFTLIDVTPGPKDSVHHLFYYGKDSVVIGDTIIRAMPIGGDPSEGIPVVDGFKLVFSNNPPALMINRDSSGWNSGDVYQFDFNNYLRVYPADVVGNIYKKDSLIAADFEIIFSDVGVDTSKFFRFRTTGAIRAYPSIPVNFTIRNKQTGERIPFAFYDADTSRVIVGTDTISYKNRFSMRWSTGRSDEIIMLVPTPTPANPDSVVPSWIVRLNKAYSASDTRNPKPGDVLTIKLDKPFLAHDTYEFSLGQAYVDKELAKNELDKIKVVPNPYIVTNVFEPRNEYIAGARERAIHFTHLPANCVIRIYNVRGQLVNTIYHNSPINNGTAIWNLLTKDRLEVAYGVYIYHVTAEGIGEKIGKFAIIK